MHRWASVEANVFLVTKQNTTINPCEKCFVDQTFAALSIKCLKHKNTGGAKQSHNASLNKLKRIPSTHLFSTYSMEKERGEKKSLPSQLHHILVSPQVRWQRELVCVSECVYIYIRPARVMQRGRSHTHFSQPIHI